MSDKKGYWWCPNCGETDATFEELCTHCMHPVTEVEISDPIDKLRAQLATANERIKAQTQGMEALTQHIIDVEADLAKHKAALRPFAKEHDEWLDVIKRAPGCSLMAGWMVVCINDAAALIGDGEEATDEKETG